MSALTNRVLDRHVSNADISTRRFLGCSCNAARLLSWSDYAAHVAEVTEAAVREHVATEIERAVTSPLYPTHPNVASPNGRTYMSGVAAGIETARIIARTPTKEK